MQRSITEYPPCHRAKSSPQQWDADFENLYLQRSPPTTAEGFFEARLFEERHGPLNSHEENLYEYARLARQTRDLQHSVSAKAAMFLRDQDFAAKWQGASVKERAKHALIGIAGACAISPNLNQARLSCTKELRVKYLSENGQVLLDLLNAIAPADFSELPTEVQYINNAEWDRVKAAHQDSHDEVEKLTLNNILVLRTKLITYALQFIIYSFLGHELPKISVCKKAHTQYKASNANPMSEILQQAMIAKYGKGGYKAIAKEFKEAYKERAANKISVCQGCAKQSQKRDAFKKCAACWKINREVLYCSRECQVANWKAEHKLYCGKPLNFDTAATLATIVPKPQTPSGFTPPDAGFKRPLELLLQIDWLKRFPDYDYAVKRSVYENNEDTALIVYTDPVAKGRFRTHRDIAMRTGDRRHVAIMCEYILWDIESRNATDFRKEKVVEQLSREYAVPLDTLEGLLKQLDHIRSLFGVPVLTYYDVDKAILLEKEQKKGLIQP